MKKNDVRLAGLLIVLGFFSLIAWYIFAPRNVCNIPIEFLDDYDAAYTTIKIEGQKYFLLFDTGSSYHSSLKKEILEKLKKTPHGTIFWYDFKGNRYESPNYILPKISIGKAVFTNMWARERSMECVRNRRHSKDPRAYEEYDKKIDGSLGPDLFAAVHFSLFLDLGQKKAFLIKDIHRFHEDGISIKNMIKVPIKNMYSGLCIQVETDAGKKYFVLDTGATRNFIKDSLAETKLYKESHPEEKNFTYSKFVIGDKDFGGEKFYLLNIGPHVEGVDGALGMSFFKKYVVLFDFPNSVVYIGPSQKK